MSRGLKVVFAVLFVFVVYVLLFPSVEVGPRPTVKVKAKNDVVQITTALKAFEIEYGSFPQGDTAAILAALQGANPRKVVFLEISPKDLSKTGLFLDPWGTPYAIGISRGAPWAYSFGKDRRDEGGAESSDDVVSWQQAGKGGNSHP